MTVQRNDDGALRFTLRIGQFSGAVARGGIFTSPVFRRSASGGGWSLAVHVGESEDTVFRLIRRDPCRHQSVTVRLTVVDCVGSHLLSAKRRLHFQGLEGESQPVMRLKGDQVTGWRGLKGLCFLPNDTLTLRCEIDESEGALLRGTNDFQDGGAGWRDSYLLSVPATGVPLA